MIHKRRSKLTMCTLRTLHRLSAATCVSALIGLGALLPTQNAQAACGTGEGGTLGVDNLGPVHIGDTVHVTLVELANLNTSFKATNFNTFVVFPDNSAQQVNHIALIPAGTSCDSINGSPFDLICPGGGSSCIPFN